MAKREAKVLKFTRLGLLSAAIAAASGLGSLFVLVRHWSFSENLIFFHPESRGPMVVAFGLFVAVALGLLGFLGGLEGAANGEGKVKLMGWLGFFVGVLSTMTGVVLGLCFHFYRM